MRENISYITAHLAILDLRGFFAAYLGVDDAVLLARVVRLVLKVILEREMRWIEAGRGVLLKGEILSSSIVPAMASPRGNREVH